MTFKSVGEDSRNDVVSNGDYKVSNFKKGIIA